MLWPGLLSHRLSAAVKTQISIRTLATASRAPSENHGRWLSDTKRRLGKLFLHGTTAEETREASDILKDLTKNWRDYVAASEGFLTGETRRGLYRHNVVWGDMDSMVIPPLDQNITNIQMADLSFLGAFPITPAHVNNVTYARWAEASRINWAWNIAKHHDPQNLKPWSQLWTPKGLGLILKSIRVDYKFPVEWPDKVTVYHKLGDVSTTSFTLDVIIISEKHQRPAARCHEDIVVYNYQPADKTQLPGKAHIPDFMKVQFDETLRLQKEAKEDALENIRDISKRVEGLEMRVLGRQEMT
ncbi:hypothetical protein P167DRAFT_570578 [Morchella conica CCBAS932]|uniref:Thioesterase/thiol ester dehydrase-isomerase n=1 Tax=Morchella conica CCBAS932 TaxID=1392247 RepID=A0A3N4L0J5_9PEZI|nr:hypothetical protein P167DRAFT_570578 [Morchella conica CCBAS932]